mgnify:CR=1 FL=1
MQVGYLLVEVEQGIREGISSGQGDAGPCFEALLRIVERCAPLLADYDAGIRTSNWDTTKQKELADKMAALIKTKADENEAYGIMNELYIKQTYGI